MLLRDNSMIIKYRDRTKYSGIITDPDAVKNALATNFIINDFRPGGGYSTESFELDDNIMHAIIVICVHYGIPNVTINSTRRTKEYNKTRPNASETSLHLDGKAIDFSFKQRSLHKKYKADIESKGDLYGKLRDLGVGEFLFYTGFNHIAIRSAVRIKDYSKIESDIKIENIKVVENPKPITPAVKDYYEYLHIDSSIATIDELFNSSSVTVLSGTDLTIKQFLNYSSQDGVSNLKRLWLSYSVEQKNQVSSEYKSYSDELSTTDDPNRISELINLKRLYELKFEEGIIYPLNTGTTLIIPKNKANIEFLSAVGKDVFLKQQDLSVFMAAEMRALVNDPSYFASSDIQITNGSYTIQYLHLMASVWIYIKSIGRVFNVTPFIKSVDTNVNDVAGNFSVSMASISSIDEIYNFSGTYYNYKNVVYDRYTGSWWKRFIQQNDVVFIRFEKLDLEKDRSFSPDLEIPFSDIPNQIYDMIGLVDTGSDYYSSAGNMPTFTLTGRDLNKLILEDSNLFMPFALIGGGKEFFLNYNQNDKVFKRLFVSGEFQTLFTGLYRSIRDSLGFIFNQLTNVGILNNNDTLVDGYKSSLNRSTGVYEDRVSKVYTISDQTNNYIKEIESNGLWKIVKVIVDNSLDQRRLNNGELSNPEGPITALIKKICHQPFVEFWGDTVGDQFLFIARQFPFTKNLIRDYFNNNEVITINGSVVSDVSLNWDETYYSIYQLRPLEGLYGSSQFISGTVMPVVYFEEFANLFGLNRLFLDDPYLSYNSINGSKGSTNLNNYRESLANDLRYIIESTIILPFTRKGSITIAGGDRRIKKGMWILFEPTNEIMYVKSVGNSLQVSQNNLSRVTTIQVERCMKYDYSVGVSENIIQGKPVNYFDVINFDLIVELISKSSTDSKRGSSELVNGEIFDFFTKRKQMI